MVELRIAEGITRKVSLIFVGLSLVGWITFIAGFESFLDEIGLTGDDSSFYPFWVTSVLGPILFIAAVAHAVLWGFPGSIVGSITAVLSVMYLTAVGYVMVQFGIVINRTRVIDDTNSRSATNLLFSGGFSTTFNWAVHMAFWPWFKKDPTEERDYSTA